LFQYKFLLIHTLNFKQNQDKGAFIMLDGKKTLFSGMQATGNLTLGNYLGALNNWLTFQDDYQCFYCVVDLHSLTVRQDPAELRKRARNLLILYIAAGLDPVKNCIYYQSHVSAHAELSWILNCFTYMGELNRMTQFKDKAAKHSDNINAGLYTYPVLMAADILLFQTDVVPVGADQKQHLEITRDIAVRFNNIYGDVFTIPEPYFGKAGAKIMSLQDPTKKMSKSDENVNASIYLMDDPDTIIRKFKRAVTDSENQILYSDSKPGIKNLIDIYSAVTKKTPDEVVKEFDGKGYGEFKMAVGEAVASLLKPIQERVNELTKEKSYIDGIIKENAEKANYYATKTLRKVQKKIGLPERIR
jgi:tryptophanyl-tRNA synthetase